MNKIYAGIGSRNTPPDICKELTSIALILAFKGYTLRSGGAAGADHAFEYGHGCNNGVLTPMEIWLPWKSFNKHYSTLILEDTIPELVIGITSKIYDRWDTCSEGARKLHARNVYQILGHDLDKPVDFVVCWTDRDDTDTGGTQFGIHLAKEWKIPVYNFYKEEEKKLFYKDLDTWK